MALSNLPTFPVTPKSWRVAILNADGTYTFAANASTSAGRKTLITAGSNGTLVEAVIASNTDASNAYGLQLIVLDTIDYVIATINVPLSSGFTTAAPPVNLLSGVTGLPVDVNGNPYLYLPSGTSLCVGSLSTVTSAKQISLSAVGADF